MINQSDPRFAAIDAASFASKNLYNAALYVMRQSYIYEGKYLNYTQMDKLMKQHEAYKALPAKVAQQILMQLANEWESFFKARAAYKEDPSKFTGRRQADQPELCLYPACPFDRDVDLQG